MTPARFAYLRRYRDPHRGLVTLHTACRQLGTINLVRVPMQSPLSVGRFPGLRIGSLLGKLMGHVMIVAHAVASNGKTLLIREYLTVPLFFCAPFLWPRRKSLWFLCQHNVGLAVNNPLHRLMLKTLHVCGFKFLVYDNQSIFAPIGRSHPDRLAAIPFPLPKFSQSVERIAPPSVITIGFVGNFRPEKSPAWAMDRIAALLASGTLSKHVEMLVGSGNDAFLNHWAARARVVNTGSYSAYLGALAMCDIVVLPYDETAYSYRTSGVLAEAVALGCVIVAPDIPGLREQVNVPAAIGVCYAGRAKLEQAVASAIDMVHSPSLRLAFDAQRRHRSLDGVTAALRRITRA